MAITYIPFRKEQYNHVERVLSALSKRDKSFKYWIKERKSPGASESEYVVLMRSYSLNQAHKRGLLITRKYLSEIKPLLRYKAVETWNLPRQVDLQTRSLKALSDARALSLLVALKSAEPMSARELSKALGINTINLRLTLRKLRELELVTDINRKIVLTELGSTLLTRMHSQGSGKSTNERQ